MNARWSGSFKPCGPWMRLKLGRYFAAPTRKLAPAALPRGSAAHPLPLWPEESSLGSGAPAIISQWGNPIDESRRIYFPFAFSRQSLPFVHHVSLCQFLFLISSWRRR